MKKLLQRLLENRWWVLFLGTAGIAALFFLASSLDNLSLKPAIHYVSPDESRQLDPNLFRELMSISLIEKLLLIGLFLMLTSIVLLLLTPEGRKRLLKSLFQALVLIAIISIAADKYAPKEEPVEDTAAAGTGLSLSTPPEGVVAVYTPPSIPPWVIFLVGLALVLIFLAVAYWIWTRTRPRGSILTKELARIARTALDEIRSGGSFEDTVVQCYVRMGAAVTSQRGLERPQAMTPSEFALRLEQAGLPSDPVRRLTRLFEKVRYGGMKSSQSEADEAISCLTAILHYCGEEV